jgi:DNA-binding MarR family transcriptional regulator
MSVAKSVRTDGTQNKKATAAAPNPELQQLIERLPLWKRPGYLIRRLHQVHYALFFEECEGFGITPVQYGLLTILSGNPDSDQISLAQALGIDRTNVADVLVRLAARGLVRRVRDPSDRRAKLASLTPKGRKLTASMFAAMQRAQDRLLAPLSQKERDAFMTTLVRLIEANNAYGRTILRME